MKYLKLFESYRIECDDFPDYGHELSNKSIRILLEVVSADFLKNLTIKVDDGYYYFKWDRIYNKFETFSELRDYIFINWFYSYTYKISKNKKQVFDEDILNIIRKTELDLSFDNNWLIIVSSERGQYEIVRHLLKDPNVDPSINKNSPFKWAVYGGHLRTAELLLMDSRVNPGDDDNEPFKISVIRGDTMMVELLLKSPKVDPSYSKNFSIRIASNKGFVDIVKLLLKDPRVDPSDLDNEAIKEASKNGFMEIVELLLKDPRVDPSVNNNEIVKSCEHRYIVSLLLKNKKVRNKLSMIDYLKIKLKMRLLSHVI